MEKICASLKKKTPLLENILDPFAFEFVRDFKVTLITYAFWAYEFLLKKPWLNTSNFFNIDGKLCLWKLFQKKIYWPAAISSLTGTWMKILACAQQNLSSFIQLLLNAKSSKLFFPYVFPIQLSLIYKVMRPSQLNKLLLS